MINNDIEALSVGAVKKSLIQTGYLDPFISENDKRPSWDGYVDIHSQKERNKENILGRVAVQVKGIENNNFNKKRISYSVQLNDLKNFLNDGGAIFFVVYIDSTGEKSKIYYNALTPMKLKKVIKEAKRNISTKTLQFEEFPKENNKKATIFLNFWDHCKKQSSFSDVELPTIKELQEMGVLEELTTSISGFGLELENPINTLLHNKDVNLYAKLKGYSVPQPTELNLNEAYIIRRINKIISVKGIPYYDHYSEIQSDEGLTIKIGESFTISNIEKRTEIKIKYNGSNQLRILTKDLDFMLAVLAAGQFEFDDQPFPIDTSNGNFQDFNIDQQQSKLAYLEKVVEVFNMLGAISDINLSKLSQQEIRDIGNLVTAFIDKKPVSELRPNLPLVLTIKIVDFTFALVFIHVPDLENTYNIYDFFTKELNIYTKYNDGREGATSQFVILSVDNIREITNIKFNVLLPSFQKLEENQEKYTQANSMLLNLLSAYDASEEKRPELLRTASDFAEWLMTADEKFLSKTIRLLNRLQVIRRQRELSKAEIKELCDIIENGAANEEEIVGAYLLLNNQEAAEIHFNNLNPETKDAFKTYPIFKFWK